MTDTYSIRPLTADDPAAIFAAFAAARWDKPMTTFDQYLADEKSGERSTLVATVDHQIAGYVTLFWRSPYEPFDGIPEIQDFNVLPAYRRRGIGSSLMDAAEQLAAEKSDTVGLGVGLYADYGTAQRMYVRRGYLPDGRGVIYDHRQVPPGDLVRLDDDAVLMFTKSLA